MAHRSLRRWFIILAVLFGATSFGSGRAVGAPLCVGGGADDWVGCAFGSALASQSGISLSGLLLTIDQPDQRGYALAQWPGDPIEGKARLSLVAGVGLNPQFILNSSILYTGHAGLVNPGCTGRCSEVISIGGGIDDTEDVVGAFLDDSYTALVNTHAEANGATDAESASQTMTAAPAQAQAQAFAAAPGQTVLFPTDRIVSWGIFGQTIATVNNGPPMVLNQTLYAMNAAGQVTAMNLTATGSLASGDFSASGTFSHTFDLPNNATTDITIEEKVSGFLRVQREGFNLPEPPVTGIVALASVFAAWRAGRGRKG